MDALEHMEGESRTLREHVSCEDLLEFACDVPNSRRTRGKSSGVNSDEVRIMGKVLGNKVCSISRRNPYRLLKTNPFTAEFFCL